MEAWSNRGGCNPLVFVLRGFKSFPAHSFFVTQLFDIMSKEYSLAEIAAGINEPTSRKWQAVVKDDKVVITCEGKEVPLTKSQAVAVMGLVYNAAVTETKQLRRQNKEMYELYKELLRF